MESKSVIAFHQLEKPPGTGFAFLTGEGVALQRNLLIEHYGGGDWLLFMDSDMVPAPDALMKLLSHGDLDIVHAVCCQRVPPYYYCTWDLDAVQLKPPLGKNLIEASGCGMAFTLIRRRVFEKMPKPWFEVGKGSDPTAMFEDVWFCIKARRLGFRIWADPTITVWHLMEGAVAPGPDGYPKVVAAIDTIPQIERRRDEVTDGHGQASGRSTGIGSRPGDRAHQIPAGG